MDGRQEMTSFYLNRELNGSGNQSGGLHTPPPGFKSQSHPNLSHYHRNPSFKIENMGGASGNGGGVVPITAPGSGRDSVVKKKRGRPRKYTPNESGMELALIPTPLSSSPGSMKKNRGRPPGSGWKQRLANVGEWMNNSAGLAFTPFIINVSVGEDVAEKISSFSQKRPRALCILSGSGTVSVITLRQFTSGTVTYEGRFEILCLSGSYLLGENGGSENRTGGLSISVCGGDGNVIGGAIGGRLVASSLVQVVVCSFVYGGNNVKVKTKIESTFEDKSYGIQLNDTSPTTLSQHEHVAEKPVVVPWQMDSQGGARNSRTEIDLSRG